MKLSFLGKYSELKNHGYKFQKLYADNYMQWHRHAPNHPYDNGIRVWKKGAEVTLHSFGGLNLEAARILCDDKKLAEFADDDCYRFLKMKDELVPIDYDVLDNMSVADSIKLSASTAVIGPSSKWMVQHIREMRDMGWINV